MPLYRDPQSQYWYVRFTVGGVKVRRSTGTTSREAAEEFETKLRSDLWRQVRLGERPRYTWGEAVERWERETDTRGRDRDRERLKWFDAYLTGLALADIDRDLIEKLRQVKAAESSPSTANRHMALLRRILRLAHRDWEWLERIPTVPMYRQEKAEPRFLTKPEARKLLAELPPHLRALAEFSLETGLRMRNATHLEWRQVDMKRRQLTVYAAEAKGRDTLAVPLSARAVAILRAQKGQHPERAFTFDGSPMDDANGAAFKKACKRAGLEWLRWHDLRHTWASWHVQNGTPLHVLQELGGWKSLQMVQRYAHLSTAHLRAWVGPKKGRQA